MDTLALQNNCNLFCRLCLCSDENLLSIFDEKNVYLPQRIAACVNIEIYISDKMSTNICKTCLSVVNKWFDFKKCCDDSQSKLRQWASVNSMKNFGVPMPVMIKEDIYNDSDEIQIDEHIYVKEELEDYDEMEERYSPHSEIDESANFSFEPPENESFFQISTYETPESLLVPSYECPAPLHGLLRAPPSSEVHEEVTKKCRLCHKEFSSVSNRQRHEKDVHNGNIVPLNKIATLDIENNVVGGSMSGILKSTRLYKPINGNHFTEMYNTIRDMQHKSICILCGKQKNKLLQHLNKSVYLEKFTCYSCYISFYNRTGLMRHYAKKICDDRARLIAENDSSVKPYQHYQCLICNDISGHVLHITDHLIASHLENPHPSSCNKCEKQYQDDNDYQEHLKTICFYVVYCSICNETFSSEEEFTNHCQIIHETDAPEFCFEDYVLSTNCRDKNKENIVNNYSCSRCGDQFPTLELWCEHQKTHCDNNLNQCLHCHRVFGTLDELTEHESKHVNNKIKLKLYRCSDTNSYKAIPHYSQTKPHDLKVIDVKTIEEKENSNSEEQTFKCHLCFKEFPLEARLKKHMHNVHLKKKQPVKNEYRTYKKRKLRCSKCYQTVTYATLRNHDCPGIEIKLNNPPEYKCNYCTKQYTTSSALSQHLKIYPHHKLKRFSNRTTALDANKKISSQLVNDYDCEICGLQLKSNIAFKKHVKLCEAGVTPTTSPPEPMNVRNEKPKTTSNQSVKVKIEPGLNVSHKCNFCDMEFTSKAELNSHFKLHLNGVTVNYLYNCTFCPVACTTQNQLAKHVSKNHSENKVQVHRKVEIKNEFSKEFECKLCNKTYAKQNYLYKHRLRFHNIKSENKKKKGMQKCNQCSATFSSAAVLKQHIETSCYYCNLCKKSFISKTSLASHIGKHPAKPKFNCVKCKAVFYFQKDYVIHLRLHKTKFKCQICSQFFSSMKILLTHSTTVHGKQNIKKKIVKNPVSFKKLKVKKEVTEPVVKKVIKTEFQRAAYRCTECNVNFVNSKQLRLHILAAHEANEV